MVAPSVYLNELLYIQLSENPSVGLQLWSNLFDRFLQQFDLSGCNQLLREVRRFDLESEFGVTVFILYKTSKGTLAAQTGDLKMAARMYESVLSVLPVEEAGWVLMNLGNVYYLAKQFEQALHFYSQSREVYEKLEFLPGVAKVLINEGCVLRDCGKQTDAINLFEEASALIPVDDIETQVINLSNWANALHVVGKLDEAANKYQQVLRLLAQTAAIHLQAQITGNLGVLYLDQGNLEKAIEFLEQDLSIQTTLGDFLGQAETLNNLGITYRKVGKISQALDCYLRSAEIRNGSGDKLGELTNLRNYVIASHAQKLLVPEPILTRAIQLATQLDDTETIQWLQTNLFVINETSEN